MSIIVYGPQGCGKTRNAEALRKHFNCRRVVDEWTPGVRILPGDLVLTVERPFLKLRPGDKIIPFEQAMNALREGSSA